jgi:hypothetical protein
VFKVQSFSGDPSRLACGLGAAPAASGGWFAGQTITLIRLDIADILRQSHSTVLLVTHDQEEAMSLA